MATVKKTIGRLPVYKGDWVAGTYSMLNQVSYLGSTFQSKIDNNTATPATVVNNALQVNANWSVVSNGTAAYLADARLTAVEGKADNLDAIIETKANQSDLVQLEQEVNQSNSPFISSSDISDNQLVFFKAIKSVKLNIHDYNEYNYGFVYVERKFDGIYFENYKWKKDNTGEFIGYNNFTITSNEIQSGYQYYKSPDGLIEIIADFKIILDHYPTGVICSGSKAMIFNDFCFKKIYESVDVFNLEEKSTDFEKRISAIETGSKSDIKLLILGDSCSVSKVYVNELLRMTGISSCLNVGVSSATLKDGSSDRATYPYTSRPINTDNSTNKNTIGCQVEKIKRLKEGIDLDNGESKYTDIPDVIIIEAGTNDSIDSNSTPNYYKSQILTEKTAYVKVWDNIQQKNVFIAKTLEDTDRTNFGGAMYYTYKTLHDMYPNAVVIFVTPASVMWMGGDPLEADVKSEQIEIVANILSQPCVRWDKSTGMSFINNTMPGGGTQENPYIGAAQGEDTGDLLHPNVKGGKRLATKIYWEIARNLIR